MGLLFFGDERQDVVAMIEEVAQGVEDLGLCVSLRIRWRSIWQAPTCGTAP